LASIDFIQSKETLQITSRFVHKLRESKLIFGFHPTQQYLFVMFYCDNTFRPTDHHQAISKKLMEQAFLAATIFTGNIPVQEKLFPLRCTLF